ncbi:MAG: hypothetical protein K2M52_05295, partial [Paramuribaculum sp.]|nr:hypothetical protein [Paramuribaculum sp.]
IINRFLLGLIPAIVLTMTGCSGKTTTQTDDMVAAYSLEITPEVIDIDSSAFIDVDIEALSSIILNRDSADVNSEMLADAKIAIYRFYKNVKEVDGNLVCDIPDGASINVSETVFAALKENLQQMNDGIKEAREKGYDVVQSKPDSAYLNSLLK